MRKFAISALAGLAAFASLIPAFNDEAEARRRGPGIAAGIILGVTAAAILAGRAEASSSRRSWARNCNRLYYRCRNGNDRACYRFEARGCGN
jgi:hypothetical protein